MKKAQTRHNPSPANVKTQEIPKLEDTAVKMHEEDPKQIDIDEYIEKKISDKQVLNKKINLDDTKKDKKKKEYDIDDTVEREISLPGDIKVRLISNINGHFVDLRKYYKNYPTKRGIRMLASKFVVLSDLLKDDLKKFVDTEKLDIK